MRLTTLVEVVERDQRQLTSSRRRANATSVGGRG
jgi:hypothetical protein